MMNHKHFAFATLLVLLLAGLLGSCGKEEKTLKEICYTETGPSGPTEVWTIDFENSKITYEISEKPWEVSSDDKHYKKYKYDAEETAKVIGKWKSFDFSKWKDRYDNQEIMDGTFWRMKIQYADGETRELSGANKWPDGFNTFGIKESHFNGAAASKLWEAVK